MRKIILPLVFLSTVFGLGSLVMVGCGGSSGGKDDLSVKPKPDLLQVVDSAIAGPGCYATLMCENACTGSSSAIEACQTACDKAESKEGAMLEDAFYNCIYTACDAVPLVDGGMNGPCAYDPNNGNTFITQSTCDACLQSAESGSCMSALTACTNDTSGE